MKIFVSDVSNECICKFKNINITVSKNHRGTGPVSNSSDTLVSYMGYFKNGMYMLWNLA